MPYQNGIHYEYYKTKKGDRETKISVILVHGMFGSAKNMKTLAMQLQSYYEVYVIELCNHGRSHWIEDMTIEHMGDHIVSFMKEKNLTDAYRIGHSLGGKVLMYIELYYRDILTRSSIILDIAPISYEWKHYKESIDFLLSIPLKGSRIDIDKKAQEKISDRNLKNILLQNLIRKEESKGYEWQCNYKIIKESFENISFFPKISKIHNYPIYFIKGEYSPYMNEKGKKKIKEYFSQYIFYEQKNIGHYLILDPKPLFSIIKSILKL